MKKIALLFGFLFLIGAGTGAAQTHVSVAIGFGVPNPYVSGFVIVGRPGPLGYHRPFYRPFYRHPALVVVEPAPVFVERRYADRHRGHYHPYRPVRACRPHSRCGF